MKHHLQFHHHHFRRHDNYISSLIFNIVKLHLPNQIITITTNTPAITTATATATTTTTTTANNLTNLRQFFFRLATLIHVQPANIKKEVNKHFEELNPSADAWSTLRFIRRAALTVISDNDKTVRIAWIDQQTMEYTNPADGEVIRVHTNDMKNLGVAFATRAEEILHQFNVPVLTDDEISQVRDPLNAKGEFASLLTFNDALATSKMHQVKIGVQDLKLLTELHLNVSILTAIDGAGELRYTESLAHHFSQPNALDKRTMFWEDGRLTIHYDGMWTKAEGQLGLNARKQKSAVIRTCSPRTSAIFLRCALWTKPAEVRVRV